MRRDVKKYIAEIIAAALRHDLRVPLTLIGRNVGFTREILAANVQVAHEIPDLSAFADLMREIDNKSQIIFDSFRKFERETKNPKPRALHVLQKEIQTEIEPEIAALVSLCKKYRICTQDVTHPSFNRFARDVYPAADRTQNMFRGLSELADADVYDEASFEEVDIHFIIARVARTVRELFQNFHQPIIPVNGVASVYGNKSQLLNLFQNLLQNAVKFSSNCRNPHVSVKISVSSFPELLGKYGAKNIEFSGTGQWCAVSFRDKGPGIPPENIGEIFKPYFSFSSTDPKYVGTGVGLAICKIITIAHRGDLFLNSAKDPTEFVVVLPLKPDFGFSPELLISSQLKKVGNRMP